MLGRAAITTISAGMQSTRHPIELDEAAREAGQAAFLFPQFLDRLDRFHDLVLHGQGLAFETIFADGVDFLLYFVEQVVDLVLLFVGAARAFRAGADDLAQDVFVADDLEVVTDIGGGRDEGEKARDKRSAADRIEQVPIAQHLRKCDQVDPGAGIPKIDQDAINRLVGRDVEILLVNFLDDFRDDVAGRDEHGTEHALLGLDAVGEGAVNICGRTCE